MKKIATLFLSFLLVFAFFAPSSAFAAEDDITGHYFESDMRSLISKGIIGGYGDGIYKPDNYVTRAEFTSFLVRALDLTQTSDSKTFSDVPQDKWYYSAITIASGHNIIGGYPDGTFKPNNKITRQEMAAMVKRVLDKKGVASISKELTFADVDQINPIYVSSIESLVGLGIFGGKTVNGKVVFAPKDNTKRGETAAILNRMLDRIGNPKVVTTYTDYGDFNYMINNQMEGTPKVDGAGQFLASRALVEYFANPKNFSTGTTEYYQFLILSESANISADEINQKVLSGKGTLAGQAQAFIDAGKQYNVNEIYLIAHALHETGSGFSTLAQGVPVDANGMVVTDPAKAAHTVYNMYGYGAVDSDPIQGGAKYAFDRGWFSPREAIIGGAAEIVQRYIGKGQNTLYKMRWQPEGFPQYATHVEWATAQTVRMSYIYDLLDNYVLKFDLPRFTNAPAATSKPAGEARYAVLPVPAGLIGTTTDNVRFREYPGTTAGILDTIPVNTSIQIIGQNGGWYKVNYNGRTGWASGQYITFANALHVVNVTSTLNVRSQPNTNATVLGQLRNNDLVIGYVDASGAFIKQDNWYKINYNGQEAWVSGDFIKEQ